MRWVFQVFTLTLACAFSCKLTGMNTSETWTATREALLLCIAALQPPARQAEFDCLRRKKQWKAKNLTCPLDGDAFWLCCIFVFIPSPLFISLCPPASLSLLVLCRNISQCSAASSTGLEEVARDRFTNCFLAARNSLLASPFRLHFRLRFPHSAQRLQSCQISGREAAVLSKRNAQNCVLM